MGFFQKLGETAKSTASAIGSKSVELVNTGKLTVEKNNIKGKISKRFTDIGSMIYDAYKINEEPNQDEITSICREIDDMEAQIDEIEEKIKDEREKSKESKDTATEKAEDVKEDAEAGVEKEAEEIADELNDLEEKKY